MIIYQFLGYFQFKAEIKNNDDYSGFCFHYYYFSGELDFCYSF